MGRSGREEIRSKHWNGCESPHVQIQQKYANAHIVVSPAGAGFLLKVILRMRPVFAERRGRDPLPAGAGYTGEIGFACKNGARGSKRKNLGKKKRFETKVDENQSQTGS